MRRFAAVLFDCDGVLVDSEAITHEVLAGMLGELGWQLTPAECTRLFQGKGIVGEQALVQAHIGGPLPEGWLESFRERRNRELQARLEPVPHAVETVARVHALYEGRIAVVSGAFRGKLELQLAKCGLGRFFEGRTFSGQETPRSKPHPDVYLAAAAALGVRPEACLVVEDTVTGVRSGVAAGASVIAYCPPEAGDEAAQLTACGAKAVITDLRELLAWV